MAGSAPPENTTNPLRRITRRGAGSARGSAAESSQNCVRRVRAQTSAAAGVVEKPRWKAEQKAQNMCEGASQPPDSARETEASEEYFFPLIVTDAMAGGSHGAGGSLVGFTGQGLQSALLLPFILRQKDTNALKGPISADGASPKGFPRLGRAEGVGTSRHPRFGEEESAYHAAPRSAEAVYRSARRRRRAAPSLPSTMLSGERGRALWEHENTGTLAEGTVATRATAPLGGRADSTAVNGISRSGPAAHLKASLPFCVLHSSGDSPCRWGCKSPEVMLHRKHVGKMG